MLKGTDSRSYLMAGAHRDANSAPSTCLRSHPESDASHNSNTMVQATNEALLAYPRANRLEEAVLAAALDDNFEPCVLEFGSPAVGALRTSDGHAIFWIWLAGAAPGFDQLVRAAARGRPVCRTSLDWAKLT